MSLLFGCCCCCCGGGGGGFIIVAVSLLLFSCCCHFSCFVVVVFLLWFSVVLDSLLWFCCCCHVMLLFHSCCLFQFCVVVVVFMCCCGLSFLYDLFFDLDLFSCCCHCVEMIFLVGGEDGFFGVLKMTFLAGRRMTGRALLLLHFLVDDAGQTNHFLVVSPRRNQSDWWHKPTSFGP